MTARCAVVRPDHDARESDTASTQASSGRRRVNPIRTILGNYIITGELDHRISIIKSANNFLIPQTDFNY